MHSSTSSSDPRAALPTRQTLTGWCGGVLIALVVLGGLEVYWRSQGHSPTVVDGPDLWSYHRARAADTNTVTLLGWSRMEGGFSTDTFRRRFPQHRIVQLAVAGKPPVATLRDLAMDTQFGGTVICEITPEGFERNQWHDQSEFVRHYHEAYCLNEKGNVLLRCALQGRLCLMSPHLRMRRVLETWVRRGRLPVPLFRTHRFDRSRRDDFSKAANPASRQKRVARRLRKVASKPPRDPEKWMRAVKHVEKYVKAIQEHGGRVAYVRFPASGLQLDLEALQFPDDKFWDRLAATTQAATIDCRRISTMNYFDCPDLSHIDCRDTPTFTNALLDELVNLGVLPNAG